MRKIRAFLCFVSVLLGVSSCFAQQEPIFSQYMFNTLAINPAYAGHREVLSVTGLYRRQWLGIDGAPISQTISTDFILPAKKVGIGIQFYNDKLGVTSNKGLFTSYSYKIKLNNRSTLAFGLQAGLTHFSADLTSVPLTPGGASADAAFAENISEYFPNFGTGVFFSKENYYVGLSIPHLLNNSLTKYSSEKTSQYQHIFLAAGYVFKLNENNNDVVIKPSFLFKFVKNAPFQLDLNVNVWFYNTFALGISYRSEDAVIGMMEFQINEQLRFGYAYDYTVSKLNAFTSGSHELMLRYEFGFKRTRILSPRYF